MKKKICLFFLLFFSILFSQNEFEEGYIAFSMKWAKNEFYQVYLKNDGKDVYLGIGQFIDFARMKNLKFDRDKMRVKGNLDRETKIDTIIKSKDFFKTENDIYIHVDEFKEIFKIQSYTWDEDRYYLTIYPEFNTYVDELSQDYIIRKKLKELKSLEESKNKEIFKTKKKLIRPGIVKFSYSNSDFEENDYAFNIDYGTELFYGEFEISQQIAPKNKLDYVRLKYKDFYKNYNLTFGNFYLENDSPFSSDSEVQGLSFSKNDYFGIRENNTTVIEGDAFNANTVELYINGNLTDFQVVRDNKFKFTILNHSYLNDYFIKIFYKNGKVDEKKIKVLGDYSILNRGENDFIFQIGEGVNNKEIQAIGRFNYGVTNYLTTFIGGYSLKNEENSDDPNDSDDPDEKYKNIGEYQVGEIGFSYIFGLKKYPTLISSTFLQEFNSQGVGNKFQIQQPLPWQMSFLIEGEIYDEKIANIIDLDHEYNFELSRNFYSFSTNLGYVQSSFDTEKTHETFLNINFNIVEDLRVEFGTDYTLNKNEGDDDSDYISNFLKFNYYGFTGMSVFLEGKVNYDNDHDSQNEIRFGVLKTPSSYSDSFLSNVDASLEVAYSEEEETTFELRFTYIFDRNIYIEFPDITTDKERTQVGGKIEKSFYLGNPLLPLNNDDVTDGWISGKVFIDENNNGILDQGETTYPGAEVESSGGSSISREDGKYIIGNISSNTIHTIGVNRKTIDPMLIQSKEVIEFKGPCSSEIKVNIPLVPVSMVSGYINYSELVSENNFQGFLGGLDIILLKDGKEVDKTITEVDGYYFFEEVIPGNYTIKLSPNSKRYQATVDKVEIPLLIKASLDDNYHEENDFMINSIQIINDKIED